MGLIDVFSDGNEKDAAKRVDKGYKKGFRAAKGNLDRGFKGLDKSYSQALNQISRGANQGADYITEGRDNAIGEFAPYADAAAPAAGLYSDAIGLNGESGNARAVDAFQTGPGYDFRMDQGMQALQRLNASRGRLDSGNTMIDAMGFAGGLADQEYGTWLDRLSRQQEFGAGIAGQRAGIMTGAGADLGDLAEASGTRRAAVKTGLGDVKMGLGEKKADLSYATRLGRAGVEAGYLAGKDQSGMNAISTVLGGASLGAKLLGAG
jgi:hypothetical protein